MNSSKLIGLYRALLSIILTFLVTSIFLIINNTNPLLAYYYIFIGAFGNINLIIETLVRATPILIISLGLAISFRCKVWNIGAEGQLYIGAMLGTITAIALGESFFTFPIAFIMSLIGGALWASIPAFMKSKLGINEVITTFLMNFISINFVQWLLSFPLKSPETLFPESERIPNSAILPVLIPYTRMHLGIVIAFFLILPIIHFIMMKTTFGFKLKVVGENPEVARYSGIDVEKILFLALVISGALAGMAGFIEVAGIQFRMRPTISPGYGYTGIVIALLGQNNPIGISLASIFIAAIINGSSTMSRMLNQPQGIVDFIQGLLIMFVLASNYILRYVSKKELIKL
ncbi:MAG: ABC transporter permease [Candidatus Verstraetearchaeota archaeon]|jgi:simple sugar transport system permease protein|nr:ABC transporter permease [Candidatus Verstraetearchaeota archaeon]